MKHALILCLIACFYGIYAEDSTDMRLIRFNESYTEWMTIKQVEDMVTECKAKTGHTGFIDVTMVGEDFVPKPQRAGPIPAGPTHQALVNKLIEGIKIANIWATITSLSNDYNNRYYTQSSAVQAVTWLEQQYRTYAGSRLGNDITVFRWDHTWAQPSLVVEIRGTKSPGERVIIGGHIDSTAGSATARAPGADDDASGSATVLEIFRVLASDSTFRPECTIEFHAYAAEEVGLRGSQDIAKYYYDYKYTVIGQLQLDMTGWVGAGGNIGLVTDYTNSALTTFVRATIGAYCNIGVVSTTCGYGCSDHASWYNYGYPASFTFESTFTSSNPYIHSNQDTTANLTPEHIFEFACLGLGFAVELSFA